MDADEVVFTLHENDGSRTRATPSPTVGAAVGTDPSALVYGASKPAAISNLPPGVMSETGSVASRRASLASVGLSAEVGEGLDDMFCTVAVQLSCLWDELGMTEVQREGAIRTFRAEVEEVMQSGVRKYRGKVATVKKEIDGAADKILEMSKALGIEADLVRSSCYACGTDMCAAVANRAIALRTAHVPVWHAPVHPTRGRERRTATHYTGACAQEGPAGRSSRPPPPIVEAARRRT